MYSSCERKERKKKRERKVLAQTRWSQIEMVQGSIHTHLYVRRQYVCTRGSSCASLFPSSSFPFLSLPPSIRRLVDPKYQRTTDSFVTGLFAAADAESRTIQMSVYTWMKTASNCTDTRERARTRATSCMLSSGFPFDVASTFNERDGTVVHLLGNRLIVDITDYSCKSENWDEICLETEQFTIEDRPTALEVSFSLKGFAFQVRLKPGGNRVWHESRPPLRLLSQIVKR